MTQITPTTEQIAEIIEWLRNYARHYTVQFGAPAENHPSWKHADQIEALAAQLAEAQTEISRLKSDIRTGMATEVWTRLAASEAAAASARETAVAALTDAHQTIKALHGPVAWEIYDRSSPEMKRLNGAIKTLKSTPARVTRAPAPAEADGWRQIETAPKSETVIAYGSAGMRFMRQRETGQWENMMHIPRPTPSAWRPLPPPPSALQPADQTTDGEGE